MSRENTWGALPLGEGGGAKHSPPGQHLNGCTEQFRNQL